MTIKIVKHARISPEKEDGFRLLVTRYWLRGLSKSKVSEWDKNLAPSTGLLSSWKNQNMDKEDIVQQREFHLAWCRKYKVEMKEQKERINALRDRSLSGETITLLCACHDTEFCHRTVLKDLIENGWGNGD